MGWLIRQKISFRFAYTKSSGDGLGTNKPTTEDCIAMKLPELTPPR